MTRRRGVAENALILVLVAASFAFAVSRQEPVDPAAVDVGALEDFPRAEPVLREIRGGFVDPMPRTSSSWRHHYDMYSLTGERLTGPQERGLDRFPARIDGDGRVLVDLTRFEPGRRAA